MLNDSDVVQDIKRVGVPLIGVFTKPVYYHNTEHEVKIVINDQVMVLNKELLDAVTASYEEGLITVIDTVEAIRNSFNAVSNFVVFSCDEKVIVYNRLSNATGILTKQVVDLFVASSIAYKKQGGLC